MDSASAILTTSPCTQSLAAPFACACVSLPSHGHLHRFKLRLVPGRRAQHPHCRRRYQSGSFLRLRLISAVFNFKSSNPQSTSNPPSSHLKFSTTHTEFRLAARRFEGCKRLLQSPAHCARISAPSVCLQQCSQTGDRVSCDHPQFYGRSSSELQ